jgi:hypothetical protein
MGISSQRPTAVARMALVTAPESSLTAQMLTENRYSGNEIEVLPCA